jgi:hypothetical protein
MEVRRIRKHFYCNLCNQTFSKLVDPNNITEVHCSNCNRTFLETIERPRHFIRNNDSRPLPAFTFWNQRLASESMPPISHAHEQERLRQPQFRARRFVPQEETKLPNFEAASRVSKAIRLLIIDYFDLNDPESGFGPGIQLNLEDFRNNFASNFNLEYIFRLGQLLSMQTSQSTKHLPPKKLSPVFKLEKKHCSAGANDKLDLPGCAICCSNIALGEECQLLPCGHMYHPACVKPWLYQHSTCPTCRYELPTDDPAYERTRINNASRRDTRRTESMNPQRRVPSRQVPVRSPSRQTGAQQTSTLPPINPKANPQVNTQPKTNAKPAVRPNQRVVVNPLAQNRAPPRQITVHREVGKNPGTKATPIITSKMIRKP